VTQVLSEVIVHLALLVVVSEVVLLLFALFHEELFALVVEALRLAVIVVAGREDLVEQDLVQPLRDLPLLDRLRRVGLLLSVLLAGPASKGLIRLQEDHTLRLEGGHDLLAHFLLDIIEVLLALRFRPLHQLQLVESEEAPLRQGSRRQLGLWSHRFVRLLPVDHHPTHLQHVLVALLEPRPLAMDLRTVLLAVLPAVGRTVTMLVLSHLEEGLGLGLGVN